MTFPARCLSLVLSSSALLGQAQEAVPAEAAPAAVATEAAAPVQEVIRKAIPVDEPMGTPGASPEVANLPRTLPENFKMVYTRCEVPLPVVAITFDDGPHPQFTPRLLDYLRERDIKATFFMVGRNVKAYPQIVRRMVEEGHEIANHSWSHPLLTSLGNESLESQIKKTHDAIVEACGRVPVLYRPPYGQTRLSQRKTIREKFGYANILWDVDPLDWQSPRTAQKVHDRVLAATRTGSIILCHDIHETTVAAMPGLLDDLKAKGFQFATVTQLMQLEAQSAPPPAVAAPGTEAPGAEDAPQVAPSPALPTGNAPVEGLAPAVPEPSLENKP